MFCSLLRIRLLSLVVLLSLFFLVVFNFFFLRHTYAILSSLETYNLLFALSIPLVLFLLLFFFFSFILIPYLAKPIATFLILTTSMGSYALLNYGVILDTDMIRNIFETNHAEASAYLSWALFSYLFLTGFLPTALLWLIRIDYGTPWYRMLFQRILLATLSLVVVFGIVGIFYKEYASNGRNNREIRKEVFPFNFLYATSRYFHNRFKAPPVFTKLGEDALLEDRTYKKPILLFLVVGETARAQNFSLDGYTQETNAFTAKEGTLFFRKTASCGTATATSLPCMFSKMKRTEFDVEKAHAQEGILDVLQRAGVGIFWKENDSGCKGVCDRVPSITIDPKTYPKLCDEKVCFDEVLLENLDQEITNVSQENRLIALHLIGSHGPTYYKRYPRAYQRFTPDCPRSDIENCTQEALTNTYDNTIYYTDFVISRLIEKLKSYQSQYHTVLLYLSDHGESLGENGLYLHGTPYSLAPSEQTRVPMQFWASPEFFEERGIDRACLVKRAQEESYAHDHLFSTLLGLFGVKTALYEQGMDILSPCRQTTK